VAGDCELSAAAGVSLERRCGGAAVAVRSLWLVSAAALLSTSAAKLSVDVDDAARSDLAGFGGAA
jgi:hypothetical protein